MNLYEAVLYISVGISVVLAGLAWHRPMTRGSKILSALLLAVALANLSYGLTLMADTLSAKLAWDHVEHLGLAFIAPLALGVALLFTGHERWLRPGPAAAILLLPLLGLLANWTNHLHGLCYRQVWLEVHNLCTMVGKTDGPTHHLLIGYSFLVITGALILVLQKRRRTTGTQRTQLGLIALSFAVLLFFQLLNRLNLRTTPIPNFTPIGHFLCSALLAQAMLRYQLTEIIPFARERIVEQAPIALLLLDRTRYLVDINGKGLDLVRRFASPDHTKDRPVTSWPWRLEKIAELVQGPAPAQLEVVDGEQSYQASLNDLTADDGEVLGYILAVQDVSREHQLIHKLRRSQDQLGDLLARQGKDLQTAINEALTAGQNEARHIGEEIHDTLGQELVGLARMAENIGRSDCPDTRCREQLNRLGAQAAHAARMAREIAHNLTLDDLIDRNLPEALATFAQRLDQMFGTAVEISSAPGAANLTPYQSNQVYRIIREAAINAIKHARARNLWIDILREQDQMVVSITNNGEPLPPEDNRLPGLGLQHMHMRARLLNGALSIDRRLGDKTVVELIFPIRVS